MTGIQASQAIEEYTLRLLVEDDAKAVMTFGSTLTLPSGRSVHLGKGTVLVVRSVRPVAGGIEVAVIAQDHLHGIAAGLLAD